jgi:hypothetical protein
MKTKLTTSLILLLFCQIANGQNNTYPEPMTLEPTRVLYQKDIYQDSSSLTVIQQVIQTDSVGTIELKKRFKNWGGKTFINFSEVLVSETEDQIVLVYIVDVPGKDGIGKWYIRMITNFKDDRVRVTLFDDGNVFIPATQYSTGASARKYNITTYFKTYGKIDPAKSKFVRKWYDGVISYRNEVISTLLSCGNALTQPAAKSDDW